MSPLDAALIRRKLAVIARNLDDHAAVEALTLDEYRGDRFRLKATERLLQQLIEAAVDVNLHLLRDTGVAPTDYFDSFVRVGAQGIVPASLAQGLAPAAGLRNRLVHEYDRLDDAVVLSAVAHARRDFPAWVAAIESYVSRRADEGQRSGGA